MVFRLRGVERGWGDTGTECGWGDAGGGAPEAREAAAKSRLKLIILSTNKPP